MHEAREKMMETAPRLLSPTYYLDNFNYLLSHVERLYGSILSELETGFISQFRSLSADSQCLYIRMTNRKGRFFRPSKLQYAEIKDTATAWRELQENEFIFSPAIQTEWDLYDLLRLFTVADLRGIMFEKAAGIKQLRRPELLLLIAETYSLPEAHEKVLAYEPVVEQGKLAELEMIRLFFFGHPYGDMSQFVVRDIGNARFETYDENLFKPQFRFYEEVQQLYLLHARYQELKKALVLDDADSIDRVVESLSFDRQLLCPAAENIVRKFIMKAGKWYERNNLPEKAGEIYSVYSLPETRERLVRVYLQQGKKPEAEAVLKAIAAEPETHSEWLFASDQLIKLSGAKHLLTTTSVLKESDCLEVPPPSNQKIEAHVLNCLLGEGYEGAHTENYLWRSLFGLIFWEELYHQDRALIHQPLQRVPAELEDRRFLKDRYHSFELFASRFQAKPQLWQHVMSTYEQKYDIVNPWVNFHESLPGLLARLFHFLTLDQMLAVSLEIARNPLDNCTGFPDLFVWKEDEYHFWEIKSPNDHLSAHQVFWINFMAERGIKAEVMRVRYRMAQ